MSMLVRLRSTWPADTFGRSVRDEHGQIVRRLEFRKGTPVELDGEDLIAVQDDIGKALQEVQIADKGRIRPVEDPQETTSPATAKAAKPRTPRKLKPKK